MKQKFNAFIQFFVRAFNKSTDTISTVVTASYDENEKSIMELLDEMTASADVRELHCDTKKKKYYVVVGIKTIAIDGNTNKVFLFTTGETPEKDEVTTFVIRENVVTDMIDLIATRKSAHTEKMHVRILQCEKNFLRTFLVKC